MNPRAVELDDSSLDQDARKFLGGYAEALVAIRLRPEEHCLRPR